MRCWNHAQEHVYKQLLMMVVAPFPCSLGMRLTMVTEAVTALPLFKGGVYFECGTCFFGKPRDWLAPCTYVGYLATIQLDWLDGLLHR